MQLLCVAVDRESLEHILYLYILTQTPQTSRLCADENKTPAGRGDHRRRFGPLVAASEHRSVCVCVRRLSCA